MHPNNIRELRTKRGMTQTYLASKVGMPQGYISDFDIGRRWCYPRAQRKIAHVLGVTVKELGCTQPGVE